MFFCNPTSAVGLGPMIAPTHLRTKPIQAEKKPMHALRKPALVGKGSIPRYLTMGGWVKCGWGPTGQLWATCVMIYKPNLIVGEAPFILSGLNFR